MSADRWEDARRLEAWAGEVRVNLLRTAALVAFYGYHLLNLAFITPSLREKHAYNVTITIVVVGWLAAIVTLHFCLTRRVVPPILKYVATFWDLSLVTALLIASPDGPRSALILLYFVIVAASALRLSLRLVLWTTLGALLAALLALGHYVFWRIGEAIYYDPANAALRIDRTWEALFFLSLGATGLVAGQCVRQARRLVAGYPVTVVEPDEQEVPNPSGDVATLGRAEGITSPEDRSGGG
jgi:hypothetical protein